MYTDRKIGNLPALMRAWPRQDQDLFARIFQVTVTPGSLVVPMSMSDWIERQFGSVVAVSNQRIVKVTNLVTMEGALFNSLRCRRPMEVGNDGADLEELIAETSGGPFCNAESDTPEDSFGRIRGRHSITASSVAKFDGFHSIVIFDEHNPLVFSEESIGDYVDTAMAWAREVNQRHPRAKYFLLVWNCLWKSGGSIVHGHAQVTMTHDMHYAKIEHLRRATRDYERNYGTNYFEDLYRIHDLLGLTIDVGDARALVYLTPVRDREVMLTSQCVGTAFKQALYELIHRFVAVLGVTSFNLVIYMAPFAPPEEDWRHFPVIARLVDRGNPMRRASDVNGVDLYASSIIGHDPFVVADELSSGL